MRITIEKLVHGGAGLGVVEGKKVFVPYAAPGDTLDVDISADHGGWAEAFIVDVVEPAACRVTPRCPVFGQCGGCQWQHIAYDVQLFWKRAILKETLERIGKIPDPTVLEALPSPSPWHYRNRIQLHVDSKGRVGFYRPRSKEVVEFGACAIADEALNAELSSRRAEISKRDRGIALRVGPPATRASGSEARRAGEGSFSQINTAQNEQLKTLVADWLAGVPHRAVLELYAGSGNFTFAIAKVAERVVASDIDKRAIAAAQERQAREGICNVEFLCASAARASRRLRGDCDAVLVDPPRTGCAEAIRDIVALAPKAILYISCDPATLARDAAALAEEGYRLARSCPVDMFPQTWHTESLSLFVL